MPEILTEQQLLEIEARFTAALGMIRCLCAPRTSSEHRDWMMSIPARPGHDPDLVIGDSLQDVSNLLHSLRAARSNEAKLRESLISAALSLHSYAESCGQGAGCDEALDIARLCGFEDNSDELVEWLMKEAQIVSEVKP